MVRQGNDRRLHAASVGVVVRALRLTDGQPHPVSEVLTGLGLGLFIHWLIPSLPLAVSFALAAVISPTDPIAVSAIAARTPIPKRLLHILQGESLLNDATGLVCMRFAVAAGITMSFMDVWQWRAATRLRRTVVWDTVQFLANGSIFVLLRVT